MAATATRSKTSSKTTTSSKKSTSSSSSKDKGGLKLDVRYSSVMKPNRVHTLVVGTPKAKKKKGEDEAPSAGLVVVRPIVPGCLITPTEQRLEMAPGNEVLFHVTPLA